jgi:2-C-methyl-D-erythritol 4-phosphate cytidylyltransferase / 2-C-methyl-D-erythritol 2,4-cyclodiphosphate synthase
MNRSRLPSKTAAAPEMVVALIVAAGRGTRVGAGLPKQYRRLKDAPVLTHTLRIFAQHPQITHVVCAIHPQDYDLYQAAHNLLPIDLQARCLPPIYGAESRQETVWASLQNLTNTIFQREESDQILVLVHDAARPFTSPALISRVIETAKMDGTAIPTLPSTDTLKEVDGLGKIIRTVPRARLHTAQTPQGFKLNILMEAYQQAQQLGCIHTATDDAQIVEHYGFPLQTLAGEPENIKITFAQDFL